MEGAKQNGKTFKGFCGWQWQKMHLIKHPVGKAKHLGESIQPTVKKGKECQKENQHACKQKQVLPKETTTADPTPTESNEGEERQKLPSDLARWS